MDHSLTYRKNVRQIRNRFCRFEKIFFRNPKVCAILVLESEVMGMEKEKYWVDNVFDEDGDELTDDDLARQLAAEQRLKEAMPMPDYAPQTEAEVFRRRLKREMQAEALHRLELAARTTADYAEVTD